MHSLLGPGLLAGSLLWGPLARAETLVLWMDPQLPPESVQGRLERSTGPATHLPGYQLVFEPQPLVPEDADRWTRLQEAVRECQDRWDAFDVEKGIAWQMEESIGAIDVVRDEADARVLVDALLLQGAALYWAWPPGAFGTAADAVSFVRKVEGQPVIGPWADAVALLGSREVSRADLPDQAAFDAFTALRQALAARPHGFIRLEGVPSGTRVFLDGVAVEWTGTPLEVLPGPHYLHLGLDGHVAGRTRLEVEPGAVVSPRPQVSWEDLGRARGQVLRGNASRLPSSVRGAVDRASKGEGVDTVYLAARRDYGRPSYISLQEQGAPSAPPPRFTTVLGLGAGVGRAASTSYGGEGARALQWDGAVTLDMAWSRLLLLGQVELQATPGHPLQYTDAAGADQTSAAQIQAVVGPGVYLVRPLEDRSHWLLALEWGSMRPSYGGLGLATAVGVPVGEERWLRFTLEVLGSSPTQGVVAEPLTELVFRVGIARGL